MPTVGAMEHAGSAWLELSSMQAQGFAGPKSSRPAGWLFWSAIARPTHQQQCCAYQAQGVGASTDLQNNKVQKTAAHLLMVVYHGCGAAVSACEICCACHVALAL
jgi:hypothetical protein